MAELSLGLLLLLALIWFVAFWLIGGVIFAVIGLVRFSRLNKNRFSCLFTFFSAVAAFGAAWMGLLATQANPPVACAAKSSEKTVTGLLGNLFSCSSHEVFSAAGLWFLLLLAMGVFLMLISRSPEKPRDIHGN